MKINKYLRIARSNPLSVPWKLFYIFRRWVPLDYWFLSGWSFPPEMITVLITKRCNFHCQGCSSSSPIYTKNYHGGELSTKDFKNFIDKIAWFKPAIYFCGGEPTLRDDLYELIKHAKNRGLVTAFTTNGSLLTKETIDKILNSGIDFISLSLDGSPKHHNQYRGYPKAYEKLITGLKNLIKERNLRGMRSPSIKITCIINPEDKKDTLHVLKEAETLGVDEVAFGNLMFYPDHYRDKQKEFIKKHGVGGLHMIGLEINNNRMPFNVDYKGLETLYDEVKHSAVIPVSFVPSVINYKDFYSLKEPSNRSYCLSPWTIATLLPDGLLTSCQEYIIGDVRKKPFMRLWNNKRMRDFRISRRKQVFPACFRCIEGNQIRFD